MDLDRPLHGAEDRPTIKPGRGGAVYCFADFVLDCSNRTLRQSGLPVDLGSRAFDLLAALARAGGQIVSKRELFQAAWPDIFVEESNLRVHIAAIRRALGNIGTGAIANEPGRGYRFVLPVGEVVGVDGVQHNFPEALAEIFGRGAIVEEIAALLPLRRLITLTGHGGVGKTTVARLVQKRLVSQYGHGSVLIDFAAVGPGDDLFRHLASTLRLPVIESDVVNSILRQLTDRDLLMVLDNCEHLIDGVTVVVEALRKAAPGIHILITSREPTRAHGEWMRAVEPLGCPPSEMMATLVEAQRFDAVKLFVARAQAAGYGASITDSDADLLGQIVRKLDGLPLAIELAAGRMDVLSLGELDRRLDERLDILTTGYRLADPRHQTLEAMIDWSHDLLDPEAARAWRWLGSFPAGFTLDDALVIIGASGVRREGCASLLFELASKSLVSRAMKGSALSFRLLESMRQFAVRKLSETDEIDAAQAAHARLVADRLAVRATEWDRADMMERGADWEAADIRAAIGWALLDGHDLEAGVDLVIESSPIFFKLLLVAELRRCLEIAYAEARRSPAFPPRKLGRLCLALGHALFHERGACDDVETYLRNSVEAAKSAGDLDTARQATWALFGHAYVMGDYAAVRDQATAYRGLVDDPADRLTVATLGRVEALADHLDGRHASAVEVADSALRNLSFLRGDRSSRVFQYDHRLATLAHRARALWMLGRTDEALSDCETILETARSIDQPFALGYALATSAFPVAIWSADMARAEVYLGTLLDLTAGMASNVWYEAGLIYREALDTQRAPVEMKGLTPFFYDMLATFSPSFVVDATWIRHRDGPVTWCTPEIFRARGEWTLAHSGRGSIDEAIAQVRHGLSLAEGQGALAWVGRCQDSLTRMLG